MTMDILQDTQVITSPSPSSSHPVNGISEVSSLSSSSPSPTSSHPVISGVSSSSSPSSSQPGVAFNCTGGVSPLSSSSSQSGVTLNSTSRVTSSSPFSSQPGVTLNSTCGVPSKTPLSTTISNGPTITDITTPSDKNGITGNDTSPLPYVDPMTPPVSIIITSPTSVKSLMLKIGTNITFAWKYSTNFSIPPKFINVLVQPFVNLEQYFTVVANASGNITSVIWNTGEESLPVTKYKLYIFDERGKDAEALPGRLLSYAGFTFSLFQPKDRVDISQYTCLGCTDTPSNSSPFAYISSFITTSCVTLLAITIFNYL
ncbi:hypothetical protein F8M41_014016 [Gigaspora margarita]|uniref:DUF7137 domain-containing protein n=1 Tax=Gigaspora margarita TaxID=4874 RepID=A0A8H4ARW5_GIGMA|nr:hypothetical protein F8M41_014016 [Gigaspora margarita]